MRDVSDAHFLHQRSGLDAVLRPPVPYPTALTWVPGREELYAGTRDGSIYAVDPVLGTRLVIAGLGEIVALTVHPDRKRFLAISNDFRWTVGTLDGTIEHQGKHPFVRSIAALWAGEYAILAGDTEKERLLLGIHEGSEKLHIPIPNRSAPLLGDSGKIYVARSLPRGIEFTPVLKSGIPEVETTAHILQVVGPWILGFTLTGFALWARTGGSPRSMRFPEVTCGDVTRNGRYLGFGTRTGGVALAALDAPDGRIRPHVVKAFDLPITAIAFSDRGRWLAAAAEGLRIFSWEEPD